MTQENHKPEVVPFPQPAQPFEDAIKALEQKYAGAHTALRETLRDIYAIYLTEIVHASEENRSENKRILDHVYGQKKFKISEQTTDLHKLVKLIVTANPQLASGYVHVLSVAHALGKTSDEFLPWLNGAHGIEAVRKKFLADGTLNPNYESGSKREKNRADKIASARHALQTPCVTIDAALLADAHLDPVEKPTEYVAIVVREPEGKIEIKGFVSNKSLIDSAYLEHVAEQARKTTPDSRVKPDATATQAVVQAPAMSLVDELATIADALIAV